MQPGVRLSPASSFSLHTNRPLQRRLDILAPHEAEGATQLGGKQVPKGSLPPFSHFDLCIMLDYYKRQKALFGRT